MGSKVIEGVFAINKPPGLSSAQVLRDCQKVFQPSKLFAPYIAKERANVDRQSHNQKKRRREKDPKVKIGHGGTLDPLATGVLIAGIGIGTKSLQDFLLCTKTYEAVILFGASTDTYDRVGKVLREAPYEHVTKEMVEQALGNYRGKFMQLPPLFSALKMNGKPLYEYAREGKPIPREIERRPVEVLDLRMLEWMEGGTHSHKAPTENAEHAAINVANQLWAQEKVMPAGKAPGESGFESKKRKMSAGQDELVLERPESKKGKEGEETDEVVMSGALGDEAKIPEVPIIKSTTPVKGPPAARITMTVTSGFYVRSLCHDLGAAVGSAALMAELERTRQGEFVVGTPNVLEYADLHKGEEVWGPEVERLTDEWWQKKAEVVKSGPLKGYTVEGVDEGKASGGKKEEVVKEEEPVKAKQEEKAPEVVEPAAKEEIRAEDVAPKVKAEPAQEEIRPEEIEPEEETKPEATQEETKKE